MIQILSKELDMDTETVRKRVEKVSSIERIKTNVEKSVGDTIRDYGLEGVKVDEDYKRYYPYGSLASKVLGFTGGDNQGIIGLEVKYEEVLKGENGKILTTTDARGVEIDQIGESRKDPVPGENLKISLDIDIQQYAQQAALKVMEEKQATRVSILLMNPQNGEIYACVNVPEFDLNDPFTLNTDVDTTGMTQQEKQDLLNQMWRNPCLNDTYEPGSTFKIITMSAGLEAGVVSVNDRFYCPPDPLCQKDGARLPEFCGRGTELLQPGIYRGRPASWRGKLLSLLRTIWTEKENRRGSSRRSRNHYAQNGKYGKCRAGHSGIRPVFSDHAHSACHYRKLPDQRGKADHAPFWSVSAKC